MSRDMSSFKEVIKSNISGVNTFFAGIRRVFFGRMRYLLLKDFIMLRRDIGGIILMFVMPIVLVVLMANLQESTFNVVKGVKIPLFLVNNDVDELGSAIEREIESSGVFEITRGEGSSVSEMEMKISASEYLLGIFIPKGATQKIKGNVQRYVLSAFNGIEKAPLKEDVKLTIMVDPTANGSFYALIMSTIQEKAQKVQFAFIMKEITSQVNDISPVVISADNFSGEQFTVDAKFAIPQESNIVPNAVQHNIPAWSLFAIFFIVVSLASNIIKEREGGSFTRLLTMPCTYTEYLLSKAIIYLVVALLQFAIMLLIGFYLIPYIGLPALEPGHSLFALIFMALSAAVAAIGYGIAIGNIARTNQQASVFGAVSVVIFAAVGGIWIPIFIMSPLMQFISRFSPLNWGMSGFYQIFLKDEGLLSVLPYGGALLLFGAICFIAALLYKSRCSHYS